MAAVVVFLGGVVRPVWAGPGGDPGGVPERIPDWIAERIEVQVVDAVTHRPVAGAEVAIAGRRGIERTDAEGRLHWTSPPRPPFVVIVMLRDGRVARPIQVATVDPTARLTLRIEAAVNETLTVTGAAPALDVTAGASSTRVSGRSIELAHPFSLSQALESLPGIATLAEGQSAVPVIRGLARGRTLLLVDGQRVSSERRAGANASFLDPLTLASIEIARGPGSVAYGSDAFGGVINARMRQADPGAAWGATLSGTAGQGLPERSGRAEVSKGYGAGGVLAEVHARDVADYHSPGGVMPYSSWHDLGGLVGWTHDTRAGRIHLTWLTTRAADLGRPRSDSNTIVATSPYERTQRLAAAFERPALAGFEHLRVEGSSNWTSERTEQNRLPTPARARSIDRSDQQFRDQQVRAVADRHLGALRVQIGGDVVARNGLTTVDTTFTFDALDQIASVQTSHSIVSARRTDAGVFSQGDVTVSRWLRLSGGARGQFVHTRTSGGYFGIRAISHSAAAGLGAITLLPMHNVSITLQAARGFRDPTLSDRFYRGPVGRGFIEGNPDLVPETSRQFDLIARYSTARVRAGLATYDYRITNLVERYAVGATNFFYRNRSAAHLRGAEVDAQLRLWMGFALDASGQWSRGRDATDGTPVDDVAPAAASMTIRHELGARLTTSLRVASIGAHRDAGPSEVATSAYTVVDAGAAWRVRSTRAGAIELRVNGRNLSNASYASSAGPRWVLAPGRSASITLVVRD